MTAVSVSDNQTMQVVQQVRAILPQQPISGVTLCVLAEDVWQQHGYWHVPVRPSGQPQSLSELIKVIADTEVALMEDCELNILIDLAEPE